jgi:hypothetical protein
MVAPDARHPRRSQAEVPLIGLFGRPPLQCGISKAQHLQSTEKKPPVIEGMPLALDEMPC